MCKTKDSSNTDGSVSFALIIRIIMIVIKTKLRSNLCFPGVLKKKSLMYKDKKVKRDYKIHLRGVFMLKLQTQGNTLGQRGTPGFWDTWMCPSGDPWYRTRCLQLHLTNAGVSSHKIQLSKP